MNHDLTAEKRETLANKWTDILKVPVTCCSCIFGQFCFSFGLQGVFCFTHTNMIKHVSPFNPNGGRHSQGRPSTADAARDHG